MLEKLLIFWSKWQILLLTITLVNISICIYNYVPGADPEISKGGGGWGEKFWKKNVCWYTYQRVYTWKLDKHATLSLFFLFKRIVFYLLLCFITLFYFWNLKKKGGGGCNPRNLALDPPMNLKILGLLIRTNAMVLHPFLFLCCLVVQSRSESGIYLFLQLDGYIILSKSLIIKANFKQLIFFFKEIAVWSTQWYLLLI